MSFESSKKVENTDDPKDPTKRAFLKGLGAAAGVGMTANILGSSVSDAAMFGVDRLPEGCVRLTPDQLQKAGMQESALVSSVLAVASHARLIALKFNLEDVASADYWQGRQGDNEQLIYLEFKTDPGEYRMTRTRVDLSKLSAVHINVPAINKFLEDQKKGRR